MRTLYHEKHLTDLARCFDFSSAAMTAYLSDFDDYEDCFSKNSLSDFEYDRGAAAEIE